jgi:hypothetical protein
VQEFFQLNEEKKDKGMKTKIDTTNTFDRVGYSLFDVLFKFGFFPSFIILAS